MIGLDDKQVVSRLAWPRPVPLHGGMHVRKSRQLGELLVDAGVIAVQGELEREVSHLIMDSRRVVPGCAYCAVRGRQVDGNDFIGEAIGRGASVIISEAPYSKVYSGLTYVQVEDSRRAIARMAAAFYGHPDQDLCLVGVTGTNGKTTVTHLVHYLYGQLKGPMGNLGTIRYDLGGRTLPAYKTTPESVDIFDMLAQMRDNKVSGCAMEVSSHALDQHRVDGLNFDVVAFLNLTRDHIDYHENLDSYFEVKSRLFTGKLGARPRTAVINLDDSRARELLDLQNCASFLTFGFNQDASFKGTGLETDASGNRFHLHWPMGELEVQTHLPGRYNASNVLAALAIVYAMGLDVREAVHALAGFPGVPGRLEKVEAGQDFAVLVDYAHTDDALRNALSMLREITPGKLHVVFGCGGRRDRSKRPRMVSAVLEHADRAWATADNPRGEDLGQIFSDMRSELKGDEPVDFVEDRRRAIQLAVESMGGKGDCLLIAGKGHETYQDLGETVIPFDDRSVAHELIDARLLSESVHADPTNKQTD